MSKKHKKITRQMKTGGIPPAKSSWQPLRVPPSTPTTRLFERCPRCDGYWDGDYKCSCGMEFSERTTNGRLYFSINQDYRLVWRVDHHDTVVWTRDPLQVPLKLPWLPFTITEDKLKLYLVFS